MLQRLYDRPLALAGHRHAMAALALVSFVESSVFPIPPDVLLVPMVLARRAAAWRIALVCTVASVAGGLAGYGIGHFLFETVGRALVEFYGAADEAARFQRIFDEWGWWIVTGGGLTPFPYKVVTILSGAAGLDPLVFTAASAISRGLRFFAVATLVWYFGPPIRDFVERNLPAVTAVFFVILFGAFLLIRYVF
ncbi:MAG: YqaA family protein [Rhodospirillales bacterium]|nr:YqaA family protein [Rhodospirillales bacterium]